MTALAADFVAEWEDFNPAAGKLDGTQGSLAAVDAILQGFFEDREPLEKDMRLMTAAYVFEVARAAFGGRYVTGMEPDEVVLVVGEPECAIEVMALEKVAQRALNGPADSLAFFHAGIGPLLERGVSAIPR